MTKKKKKYVNDDQPFLEASVPHLYFAYCVLLLAWHHIEGGFQLSPVSAAPILYISTLLIASKQSGSKVSILLLEKIWLLDLLQVTKFSEYKVFLYFIVYIVFHVPSKRLF